MTLSIAPIQIVDPTPSAPDVTYLTTGSVAGTGVFDVLMQSVKAHLIEEFEATRITGAEYATLYLGALDSVLAQSVQYIINDQQAAQINAEVGLIRQKTVTELAQTDNDIPIGLGFNGTSDIEGLVANQIALTESQITASNLEGDVLKQKVVTELSHTADTIPVGLGFNTSPTMDGMARASIDKIAHEADLTEQKTVTELAQTCDVIPVDLGHNNLQTVAGILETTKNLAISTIAKTDKEIIKADSEIDLLGQKTVSELAQTAEYIPAGIGQNTDTVVAGVLGKQKSLYGKQTDGFDRDAEQKLAKIMVDSWIVRQTTDGADSGLAGLAEADVKNVLDVANTGIGVTP